MVGISCTETRVKVKGHPAPATQREVVSTSACCDGFAANLPVAHPGPDVFHVRPDGADSAVRDGFIAGASDFALEMQFTAYGWLAFLIGAWYFH